MKRVLRLALVSLCSVLIISSSLSKLTAAEPQASQVVLDWAQFIKLWEESHRPTPPENQPPVDFILSRADYRGTVRPKATEIQATFDVTILSKNEWVKIPFLPSSLGLKRAALDGKPIAIAQDGGYHTLVKKGAGQYSLTAVFSVPTPDRDGAPAFSFPVSETAMTLLTLVFPEPKLDVTIPAAQVISAKNENGTTISAILSPSRHISVSWTKKAEDGKVLPAKIFSRMEQLVTIDESVARLNTLFSYSVLHSGFRSLAFRIPSGTTILSVNGDGVADWKTNQGEKGDILRVDFNRSMKGAATVMVVGEVAIKDVAVLGVPIIETVGVEREEGHIAVEAQSSVEVAIQTADRLRQIDVKEVPQGLWSRAQSPLLFGFRFNETKPVLALTIERHNDVPVLTSTIDSANALTVMTKDGQWITRASFQVRNHLKQYLLVTLPEGAEVWSAFVSGRPVKPSRDKEGRILIPLQKSNLNESEAAFPVEVLYYLADNPMKIGGKRTAFLPTVDLPVSEALWSVYVPEDFAFLHFGGNMEKERYARMPMNPLGYRAKGQEWDEMRKEIAAPSVQEEKIGAISKRMRASLESRRDVAFDERSYEAQAKLELGAFSGGKSMSLDNHVLPISFRIPEVGRVYRFGKIMVTHQQPSVSMSFVHAGVIRAIKYVILLLSMGFLFSQRRRFLSLAQKAERLVVRAVSLIRDSWFKGREKNAVA